MRQGMFGAIIALSLLFSFGPSGIAGITHGSSAAIAHGGSPAITAVAHVDKGTSQNGEGNNDNTASPGDALPDLTIEGITWSPAPPSIGDRVSFTVTIKNQGKGEAGSFCVACYVDDAYLASGSVSPLAAGASENATFNWIAQAGSHSIKAVADANNEVVESDKTNNEKIYAFSVLAPDLVVKEITWSPENPSSRDNVTFTVTIKNQGNITAGPSHVGFYIDGYSRGYGDVQSIDAGATVAKTFPWVWAAQAGSHTIRAVADAKNGVAESNKTNNEKTVTLTTLLPDLIITAITWSPQNPSERDTVTFTVTVKNQGAGNADSSYVYCYLDGARLAPGPVTPVPYLAPGQVAPSLPYLTPDSVTPLAAGATTDTVTFTWRAEGGSHIIRAVVNPNNTLLESDVTNNEKTVTLNLLPDLIIAGVTWSPQNPSVGDTVTITATVVNQGTVEAGCSYLSCDIDGYSLGSPFVPELEAGATYSVTLFWGAQAGSHVIRVIADSDNRVAETNETNNENVVTLTTLPCDLIITGITWSPQNPSVGDAVTFTVTVKNQGAGNAGSSYVYCYLDDVRLAPGPVTPLAAGASEDTAFNWIAQPGSHTIKAVADAKNEVAESNETNNEKTVTLLTLVPDLIIEAITWSPTDPSPGDKVTFMVSVKNQGTGKAGHAYVAYYVNGSSRGYHDVPELEAGATYSDTFFWIAGAGPHVIKVIANSDNRVAESNETNNEKVVAFSAPDLAIQAITWSPQNPHPSDNVTFTVTIKNQGSGRADGSSVACYVDDAYLASASVSPLAAGASENTTFSWIAQLGSHNVKAVADAKNEVVESDKTNNEKVVTLLASSPSAPTTEPTPSPKPPKGSVHLDAQSSRFLVGQDIVLNLSAENPAAKITMTVELMLKLPSGMTVTSAEFNKGNEGQFFASYAVKAGDRRQVEVHIRPDQKGSFNIAGQLAYYLGDDKTTAERQTVSLPITVAAAEAPPEKPAPAPSPEKGIHPIWGFILTVVVLGGIVFVFLSYRLFGGKGGGRLP